MRSLTLVLMTSVVIAVTPVKAQIPPPPPPPIGGGGNGGGTVTTGGSYNPYQPPVGGGTYNNGRGGGYAPAPAPGYGPNNGAYPGYPNYPNGQNGVNQAGPQPNDNGLGQQNQPNGPSQATAAGEKSAPKGPPPHILTFGPGDQILYCRPGDIVRLTGHYEGPRPLDHAFLEIDRGRAPMEPGVHAYSVVDDVGGSYEVKPTEDAKTDDYSFDWKATTPGVHTLHVGYILQNGAKKSVDRENVTVLDADPLTFNPRKLTSAVDLPVTAKIPSGANFLASNIDVFLDEKKVGHYSGAPFQFTLPLAKAALGKHALRIEAYDGNSGRYEYSNTTAVEVPTKVTLDVPDKASLDKSGTVTVTPKIADTYKPSKMEYYLKSGDDDKLVATVSEAPFTGNLDLSKVMSGQYAIHAVATASDGPFKTDDYPLTIANPGADANAAAVAKAEADKKAADADAAAEIAASQALKAHPKLTWAQLRQKVADDVSAYLGSQPVSPGGKKTVLRSVDRIQQPNPVVNVYNVDAIVATSTMAASRVGYTVDVDKGQVTPR